MKLSDYVDITRETPAYRAVWTGAMHTLPVQSSTDWLNDRFGNMPNRYLFSGHVFACSMLIWRDHTKDYELELITTDGDQFSELYTPIIEKASVLFPEHQVRPKSCVYDVTDDWERWVLDWYIAKDGTTYQPCIMIAVKDEMLALQCKLSLT
jgi:hypothetical protein